MLATIGHNASPSRCIFRAHGERGYTKLRNAFLQDRRISDETRGLVARLLSLPDDWEVTVQSIIASGKAGRDKVYRMIKEAEEYGYIQPQDRQRTDDGKLGRKVYHVSDDPEALIKAAAEEIYAIETNFTPCPENPSVVNAQQPGNPDVVNEHAKETVAHQGVLPRPENPHVVTLPQPEKPDMANRTTVKGIENNKINNPPIVPPGDEPEKRKRKRDDIPDEYPYDFEEFWKVYPRRTGKAAAFRAWRKLNLAQKRRAYVALKKQLPALKAQIRGPNENFCPHPSTWLHEGRFDDEPETSSTRSRDSDVPEFMPRPREDA
jgi:hypothetical protein